MRRKYFSERAAMLQRMEENRKKREEEVRSPSSALRGAARRTSWEPRLSGARC